MLSHIGIRHSCVRVLSHMRTCVSCEMHVFDNEMYMCENEMHMCDKTYAFVILARVSCPTNVATHSSHLQKSPIKETTFLRECLVPRMWQHTMGWLRLVGSLKLKVSFAKEPFQRDYILQKRPMIWRSLPIVATP